MENEHVYDWKRTLRGFAILALVYAFVVYVVPRPESVKPEGWRLTGIFIATIAGSITQPIPGAALVLLAVTLSALFGGLTVESALGGYADKSVWLVMAAFMISRALINTGLARRIALLFVRAFGKSSLGVSYALSLSDMVLAGMIPSNGARSGHGIILPIARSISELYGSKPGASAALLGSFMITVRCIEVHLHHRRHVLHRSGEQPHRRADGRKFRLQSLLGELAQKRPTIVPGLVSIAVDSPGW